MPSTSSVEEKEIWNRLMAFDKAKTYDKRIQRATELMNFLYEDCLDYIDTHKEFQDILMDICHYIRAHFTDEKHEELTLACDKLIDICGDELVIRSEPNYDSYDYLCDPVSDTDSYEEECREERMEQFG